MIVEANVSTITALAYDSRGSLWAGTPGGLLEWPVSGAAVRHWTRADGLPGLRVRSLRLDKGVLVVAAESSAKFNGRGFIPCAPPPKISGWSAKEFAGLPGPPIARVDWKGESVWAVPESGLWTLKEGKAQPFTPALPNSQVSALTLGPQGLAAGTGANGAYLLKGAQWTALPLPSARLKGPDATSLIMGPGGAFISPREGTAFRAGGRGVKVQGAPWRQAVEWKGMTVVRRADGRLVTIDRAGSETPLSLKLPRVSAASLFVQDGTLFVAQPGGWSEFTESGGSAHHFDLSPLEGCPTTAVLADEKNVWVGTQNNGLVQFDRASGAVKHFHEAHGLNDDWVTALVKDSDSRLLVGTYVGGLHVLAGEKLIPAGLKGGFVTKMIADGDRVWVGSLSGVWLWRGGKLAQPDWSRKVEPDVYDLAKTERELLIASGGALHHVINP